MQIVSLVEVSKPISGKNKKNMMSLSSAEIFTQSAEHEVKVYLNA